MNLSTKDPSEMTAQERVHEIASILAKAVLRGRNIEQNQDIERSLTGLRSASKHSCDDQKRSSLRTKKKAHA